MFWLCSTGRFWWRGCGPQFCPRCRCARWKFAPCLCWGCETGGCTLPESGGCILLVAEDAMRDCNFKLGRLTRTRRPLHWLTRITWGKTWHDPKGTNQPLGSLTARTAWYSVYIDSVQEQHSITYTSSALFFAWAADGRGGKINTSLVAVRRQEGESFGIGKWK